MGPDPAPRIRTVQPTAVLGGGGELVADYPLHKFAIGTEVVPWKLQTTELNGITGHVVGHAGDRIAVDFGSRGKKCLKPENLVIRRPISSDDGAGSSCASEEINDDVSKYLI